ncbi:MAG: right-handed parallel beta-helix repeat-containing protein [Candidatus Saliniplasma sp.]
MDLGEGAFINTRIIDQNDTEEWVDEEIILDEKLIIRGYLQIEDTELFIKASDGGEIIVEDGGTLRVKNSLIQPYYKRHHSTISFELDKGHNLLSFPFHRENNSIRSVLDPLEGHYESAWHYDQEEGYINFRPDREDHFNDLDEITKEMGVNLDITDEFTFEISGVLPKNSEIELQEGFNMVSYPYPEEKTVSNAFSDILDDIESVSTVISGEEVYLSENDTMVPGRGYWVEVDDDCIWESYNENGLEEDEALDMDKDKGTRIDYQADSSGYIRDSKLEFLGDSQENPGLILGSDSVSIEGSNFEDNFIDVTIESATPSINECSFENSTHGGIISQNSSFKSFNNEFTHSYGYGIKAIGGSPILTSNRILNNKGIYLENTSARVSSHEIKNTLENGVTIQEGAPLIEDNIFINNPTAVRTHNSNVSIIDNTFSGNEVGINIDRGRPLVENNIFEEEGHGLLVQQGSGVIKNNEVRDIDGWGIDIRDSRNISVKDNNIRGSSFGIRLSGDGAIVKNNLISDSLERGVLIKRSYDFVFEKNIIRRSSDTGLFIEESEGIAVNNQIIDNHAGVELKTSIDFIDNTVSDNILYGINIRESSPYLDGNIFSNNEEYALRFEDSSSVIKRASILNSRYHLYLINSQIKVINSAFRDDRIYVDEDSEFESKDILNASVDEGTSLNYNIYDYLPPTAEITDVSDTGDVEVDIKTNSIYFSPEDYFSGTVNMTFNATISGEWETKIPFSLEVKPVNNPPKILNKSIEVTYEPTRIRWEIVYEDKDGHLPNSLELVVDGNHYQMKEHNESDQDTFDGKKYYYEMYLEPGDHEYYIKATENNTLGADHTINTQYYDLDVSPPKPGWLGLSNQEAASFGTIIFIILLILLYLKYLRKTPKEDSEENIIEEDEFSKNFVKKLPVLTKKKEKAVEETEALNVLKKKGNGKEGIDQRPVLKKKGNGKEGIDERPVLKKKEDAKDKEDYFRKHRVIKEETEIQESEDEEGDVKEEDEDVVVNEQDIETISDEGGGSKKQRVIRERKTVRPKTRVIKDDGSEKNESGNLKRVLKED